MEALREILAVFTIDNASLKKGITEGNKLVEQMKDGLHSLIGPLTAAFGGAAIVGFANDLIATADATAKTADALGLGIKELQEWQHAAGLSGVATEQVTTSITKLGQKIAQAKDGNADLAKTFKGLGLDMDALAETADRSFGDAFQMVGLALAGVEDKAQRTDLAMKLFEESGPKLFNLFKGGADSIDAMKREVTELGIAFEDDFARSAEGFNDNLDRLGKAGKGFLLQVLEPIMPSLVEFTELMVRGAKAAIPLVKQFVTFTKNSQLLTAAIGMLSGKALLLGIANFGKFAGILRVATAAAFRFLLPLLLLEDLIVFLAGGKSKLGEKLDKWFGAGTADKVRKTLQEISDAVRGTLQDIGDRLKPIVEEWGPGILKFAGVLAGVALAVKAVKGAMVAWNAVMALNPVALIGAAVVAALALIVAYWPEISGFFSDLWDKVKQVGSDIGDWFSATWARVLAAFQSFVDRTKGGADWLLTGMKLVWNELEFAGLSAAAALSDAFGETWNSILAGAKRFMGVYADIASYIPGIGDQAAQGIRDIVSKLDGLTANVDATQIVQGKYEDARMALVAELEYANRRMGGKQDDSGLRSTREPLTYSVPQSNVTTNVSQDVTNTTEVHVTVPPGTPETLANRVGAAAQRGAQQGTKRNLRATQDALVPRPVG